MSVKRYSGAVALTLSGMGLGFEVDVPIAGRIEGAALHLFSRDPKI